MLIPSVAPTGIPTAQAGPRFPTTVKGNVTLPPAYTTSVTDSSFWTPPTFFLQVMEICFFCFCIWGAGTLVKTLKGSSIIGEIMVGILLGPNGFNAVPFAPALKTAGKLGTFLGMCEAGLDFNMRDLRKIGRHATVMAVLACVLPFFLVSGCMMAMGFTWTPSAAAAGIAMIPTTTGMAARMLREASSFNTPWGQLIVASAFLSDFIALVASSITKTSLDLEDAFSWIYVLPTLAYSFAFVIILGFLAVFVYPPMLTRFFACLKRLRIQREERSSHFEYREKREQAAKEAEQQALIEELQAKCLNLRSIIAGHTITESTAQLPSYTDSGHVVALVVPDTGSVQLHTAHDDSAKEEVPLSASTAASLSPEDLDKRVFAIQELSAAQLQLDKLLDAKSKSASVVDGPKPEDDFGLLCLLCNMLLWGYLGSVFSSNMMGAFLAGMCFFGQTKVQKLWKSTISPVQIWFVRIFFAASVAFTVQHDDMFSWPAFGGGVLIAVASSLGKWVAGMFVPKELKPFIVGIGLAGRGEFAFVLAVDLTEFVTLNPDENQYLFYAVLVWGLLISCFFAPFLLQFAIVVDKLRIENASKPKEQRQIVKPLQKFLLELLKPKLSLDNVRGDDRNNMALVSLETLVKEAPAEMQLESLPVARSLSDTFEATAQQQEEHANDASVEDPAHLAAAGGSDDQKADESTAVVLPPRSDEVDDADIL